MLLLNKLKELDIILASQSPRRQQLLKEANIPFRIVAKKTTETFNNIAPPGDIVVNLCRSKANAYNDELTGPQTLLIAADTIVFVNGRVLNKPENKKETTKMLKLLSGSIHDVYTGVCIKTIDREKSFFEKTTVFFEQLTDDQISFYIDKYKPYDKAGGYGIQDWIGLTGIKRIEGSYHNVVGLPVARLFKELKTFMKL